MKRNIVLGLSTTALLSFGSLTLINQSNESEPQAMQAIASPPNNSPFVRTDSFHSPVQIGTEVEAETTTPTPHTVVEGDTLWRISGERLEDPYRWTEIGFHNQLTNPNQLNAGEVLEIPEETIDVPSEYGVPVAPAPVPTPAQAGTAGTTSSQSTSQPQTATAAPSQGSGGSVGGHLAVIRECESGGNYAAVNPSGKYRGAYQFDRQTWAGVGGTGDPAAASPAEQDRRAQMLYDQRGASPWPQCGA